MEVDALLVVLDELVETHDVPFVALNLIGDVLISDTLRILVLLFGLA